VRRTDRMAAVVAGRVEGRAGVGDGRVGRAGNRIRPDLHLDPGSGAGRGLWRHREWASAAAVVTFVVIAPGSAITLVGRIRIQTLFHGRAGRFAISSVRWSSSGASPSYGYWFKARATPAGWREPSGKCSTHDHDAGERDAFGERVPRQLLVDTSACWVTIHSESNPAVTANGPGPAWCCRSVIMSVAGSRQRTTS
jgi:hypothetical protein